MKPFFVSLFLALLVGICAGALFHKAFGDVVVPALTGRVNDAGHVVGDEAHAKIAARLAAIEEKAEGHPQFAVLIIPSLDGATIEDYANRVFRAWKLGQAGRDNGLLLVAATGDRKVRLEVGYGLEGVIPDGRAAEVITAMRDVLKGDREDWVGAVEAAVERVEKFLTEPQAVAAEEPGHHSFVGPGIIIIILAGGVAAGFGAVRRNNRLRAEEELREAKFAAASSTSPENYVETHYPWMSEAERRRAALGGAAVGAAVGAVASRPPRPAPTRRRSSDSGSSYGGSVGSSDSGSSSSPSSSGDSGFSGGGGDSGGGGASGDV